MTDRFARLVIPRPGIDELYYRIEPGHPVRPGDIVEIELKKQTIWALVRETLSDLPAAFADLPCKPVLRTITDSPLFRDQRETDFLSWLAAYYLYPFPKLVKQIFAPFIDQADRTPRAAAADDAPPEQHPVTLTADQQSVVGRIRERWERRDHRPVLIHGVTGSGKSEVYAALCRDRFAAGQQVLFLVPEVSLTSGTIRHLETRLGRRAVLLHSYLSKKKRFIAFRQALQGEAHLIVGTRSALLYPFPDLGLIVVDEEHDPSYKNIEPPYYHARDAAIMKGAVLDIPVLLGSATPSSESWHNAERGKYHRERLPRRVNDRPLPPVRTFPFRGDTYLPSELIESLRAAIGRQEQALFFLNRRGFAPIAVCRDCATVQKCPRCEVALVYHKRTDALRCHHCGLTQDPHRCPACAGERLSLEGIAIERFVETLRELFPGARVASIDRDSTPNETALSAALEKIETGQQDLIAGTIMISKGHNFPALTQVIIKHADFLLALSDYRAAERCFQVVTQVAGRAGRFERPGAVWAETLRPDHYLWRYLPGYDFEGFMEEELLWRRRLLLPPFSRIAVIRIAAATEEGAETTARAIHRSLRERTDPAEVRLLPPVAPPLQRVRNRYRRHLTITARDLRPLAPLLTDILSRYARRRGLTVTCDIDALSTMQV